MFCMNSLSGHQLVVLASRAIAHPVDLVALPSGVNVVLILATQQHMIISIAGHILLIINLMHLQRMEIILNIWPQGAAMVLVGSKGLTMACRGHPRTMVVMITMEDRGVICPMLHHPPSFPVLSLHMVLVLHLYLLWAHPQLRRITIMDSHKARIMVIRHLMHRQDFLNKVMDKDMMNRSLKIVLHPNILMEDT